MKKVSPGDGSGECTVLHVPSTLGLLPYQMPNNVAIIDIIAVTLYLEDEIVQVKLHCLGSCSLNTITHVHEDKRGRYTVLAVSDICVVRPRLVRARNARSSWF